MKKTYIYIVAALALGLGSCSSDDMFDGDSLTANGDKVSFSGNIIGDLEILPEEGVDVSSNEGATVCSGSDAITRSTISNGQFASWSDGDKVSVSDGLLNCIYEATASTGTSCKLNIQASDAANEFEYASTDFYAFYPADAIKAWNGSTVTATIYAEQAYSENVDGGLFGAYMASKGMTLGADGHVSFSLGLVASVIDVNLSSLGVTPVSVSLKSNNGEIIAGTMKYDCSAQTASVTTKDATYSAANTQSDVITVSNVASDATQVRFYVLPVQMANGLTITVKASDGKYYTKSTSSSIGNAATEGLTSIGNLAATVCKPYYKKVNFGSASAATRTNNWMATIPSNTRFCMLSIPGSHDAATYGCSGFSAKVQEEDLNVQLAGGIRGFDIRPNYTTDEGTLTYDNFYISHTLTTNVLWKDAMDILVNYVKNNPTETIYVRLNKNDGPGSTDVSDQMRTLIRGYLQEQYNAGYVLGQITNGMTLGDVRGKLVITSDNPYGEEGNLENTVFGGRLGIPDNTTGEDVAINHTWSSWTSAAYVQDNYDSGLSANEKLTTAKAVFDKSSASSDNTWYMNWLNIAGTLTAPTGKATSVNEGAAEYITNSITGRTGIVMFDFCMVDKYGGVEITNAVVNQNAKYVYDKRSRVKASGSNLGVGTSGSESADGSTVYAKDNDVELW